MLQLHDLHGGQVLAGLRLWARLVGRNQQQRAVHHRSAVQHCGHENVVACRPTLFPLSFLDSNE